MVWEYKLVEVKLGGVLAPDFSGQLEDHLNALGEKGWELVATIGLASGGGRTHKLGLVFKRPAGSS